MVVHFIACPVVLKRKYSDMVLNFIKDNLMKVESIGSIYV